MIHYIKGNLLDSDCDYICHQVNCQGVMGAGIAKQIRERWPVVYNDYRDYCSNFTAWNGKHSSQMLGRIRIQPINSVQHIISIFGQDDFGRNTRHTSYDAFDTALHNIGLRVPKNKTIGFPKNIGCGLGGGNWTVIMALIEEILSPYYDVYIYEYEP